MSRVPLKLKWLLKSQKDKLRGIDQISAELIKAGDRTIYSEIHKLINCVGIRRNCLSRGRSQSLCLFIRKAIKQTAVIIEAYHFRHQYRGFHPPSCCQV